MNNLNEYVIKDISHLEREVKRCVICLEDLKNGDKVISLPCIHFFHSNCIKAWFSKKNSCPICKFELKLENMFR